ncbi:MAG: hypothetical protein JSU63_00010 [Phycisphaerales bacterium]|nr:MAG: hypothetical protein JSU63_00010 [Phycisphaerales bacterium]
MESKADHITENWFHKEAQPLFDELQKESERGRVLLGAAFLNDVLREILASFLRSDQNAVDELLGDNKPLSTFHSRIALCYCLGLITKREYCDLNNINRMRNYFAHRRQSLSFADQKISHLCGSLQTFHGLKNTGLYKAMRGQPGGRFLVTVAILVGLLSVRVSSIKPVIPDERSS